MIISDVYINIYWHNLGYFAPLLNKKKKKKISVVLSMFWWVLDCFWTRIYFCILMGMKICCKTISHVTTPCLWEAYLTSFSFNVSDFNPSKLDLVKFSLLQVIANVLSTRSTLFGLNLLTLDSQTLEGANYLRTCTKINQILKMPKKHELSTFDK